MYVATSNIRQPGIDLALALVSEDLGDHVAMEIAKNMVLFLRRPGGQAQFSVTLQSQRALGSSLDDVSAGFEDHTGEER
jgi:transcriptional regulator GlxA family with amidase domain